jgi:hypothetical protein
MFRKVLLTLLLVFWAVPLFAQSVDTAWVRRYNAPADYWDEANAIAVDDSGNVYVTGESYGIGQFYDYLTIKYDRTGNELWTKRYNGPGNRLDRASAIALDRSGNVYVTGESEGDGTSRDYVTIKYDEAGREIWLRRYGGGDWNDIATSMTTDDSANVYVTGYSYESITVGPDYATLKYDHHGNELWAARYDSMYDYAYAVCIDSLHNAYVTGTSGTLKYDAGGNMLWRRSYYGVDVIAGKDNNAYVVGDLFGVGAEISDYLTIKHYPNGDTAWARTYNGQADSSDYAAAITTDDSGNVYITGVSYGSGTGWDYGTLKYYPNGDTAWVRRYNGPGNGLDQPTAIAVDLFGKTYVTGYSEAGDAYQDYATVRYDETGNQIWVIRYDGPANSTDRSNAIVVDDSANVYVTGRSKGIGTSYDYATIKYVQFLRADVDHTGEVNLADVVYLVNYLFKPGPAPVPAPIVGDATCDSSVDIDDVVYLINYIFKDGPAPCI